MPNKEFIKTYRIKTGVIIREVASTRQGDNDRSSTFQIDVQKNGKRIRETLDTLPLAKDRCQELVEDIKADGVKILALKDEKKHLEALKRLEAFPTEEALSGARRLLDAFPGGTAQDDVIGARGRLLSEGRTESFSQILAFWTKHHPLGGTMPSVGAALEDYLEFKKSRRKTTLKQIRYEVGRFATYLKKQGKGDIISDVATATIERYLKEDFSALPLQQKKIKKALRTFFTFCSAKYKLPGNPAEAVLLDIVARDESEVEAYTVAEVKAIMDAAMEHKLYSCAVPSFAIGLFAGLRPTEAIGLDWKDVCFKSNRIRVSPQTAKRRRSRLVDMPSNLVEWLRPHAQESGLVISSPMTYRRAKEAIFKDAKVKAIADGFRHSFGTYHLALNEDANKTANQMGHRGNTDLVFSHYRKLVPKEDGKAFFEITPSSVKQTEK
jgi:integrase